MRINLKCQRPGLDLEFTSQKIRDLVVKGRPRLGYEIKPNQIRECELKYLLRQGKAFADDTGSYYVCAFRNRLAVAQEALEKERLKDILSNPSARIPREVFLGLGLDADPFFDFFTFNPYD